MMAQLYLGKVFQFPVSSCWFSLPLNMATQIKKVWHFLLGTLHVPGIQHSLCFCKQDGVSQLIADPCSANSSLCNIHALVNSPTFRGIFDLVYFLLCFRSIERKVWPQCFMLLFASLDSFWWTREHMLIGRNSRKS